MMAWWVIAILILIAVLILFVYTYWEAAQCPEGYYYAAAFIRNNPDITSSECKACCRATYHALSRELACCLIECHNYELERLVGEADYT